MHQLWQAFSKALRQPEVPPGSGSCLRHGEISGLRFYLPFAKFTDVS